MRVVLRTLALAGALIAPPAIACGHCVEDKIAAVYDHAVVSAAQVARRHVAFVAIDGNLINDPKTQRTISDIVRSANGIDRASVRVSLDLAAISFAYDPKRASFDAIRRTVGKQLAHIGLGISEMKILDEKAAWPTTAKHD